MLADALTNLSFGTIVLAVFIICVVWAVIRGALRLLVSTCVIALSAWAAFFVWRKIPEITPSHSAALAAAVLTFLFGNLFIHNILRVIMSPFTPSDGSSSGFRPVKLLLAVIPTSVFTLIGAAMLRHAGALAELGGEVDGSAGIFRNLSESAAFIPTKALEILDPSAAPDRVALAKWIGSRAKNPPPLAIDPATGEPVPRAIIVDDPELQRLARAGDFTSLLRHPLLIRALDDPAVRSLHSAGATTR